MSAGIKHDEDKDRFELLPPRALTQVAAVMTYGAKKYGDRNWEKGISSSRLFGAAMRHLWSWWRGNDVDDETQLSHLAHAACCILMILEFWMMHRDALDDRPVRACDDVV